jgi:hypothetical protein
MIVEVAMVFRIIVSANLPYKLESYLEATSEMAIMGQLQEIAPIQCRLEILS